MPAKMTWERFSAVPKHCHTVWALRYSCLPHQEPGTPIQATDPAGAIVWEGGLDPFGTPFVFPRQGSSEGGDRDTLVTGGAASTSATMEGAGIFLRFPGQWDDPSFRARAKYGGNEVALLLGRLEIETARYLVVDSDENLNHFEYEQALEQLLVCSFRRRGSASG